MSPGIVWLIVQQGWTIWTRLDIGADDGREHLDYYAMHRMTNDRHVRLYADGGEEGLPAIAESYVIPQDATETERKALEAKYFEENRAVHELLEAKGFVMTDQAHASARVNRYLQTHPDRRAMDRPSLPRITPKPHSGDEPFKVEGKPLDFTLRDYWRWSASDLLSNVQRGVLAEFLVATALELTEKPREEWAGFDLEVSGRGTVEVKSAAYIQSWKQKGYSKISFDIARRKSSWNPETGKTDRWESPRRGANAYVFCLLKHKCQKTIDPLNVDQWSFYVVSRSKLDCSEWGQKENIGLNSLSSLTRSTPYRQLKSKVLRALGRGTEDNSS